MTGWWKIEFARIDVYFWNLTWIEFDGKGEKLEIARVYDEAFVSNDKIAPEILYKL